MHGIVGLARPVVGGGTAIALHTPGLRSTVVARGALDTRYGLVDWADAREGVGVSTRLYNAEGGARAPAPLSPSSRRALPQ